MVLLPVAMASLKSRVHQKHFRALGFCLLSGCVVATRQLENDLLHVSWPEKADASQSCCCRAAL